MALCWNQDDELKQDILRGRSASKGVAKGISCVLDLVRKSMHYRCSQHL